MRGYLLSELVANAKGQLSPKYREYAVGYSVKAGLGKEVGDWAFIVVFDASTIPPEADQDAKIIVLTTGDQILTPVPNGLRGQINGRILNQTNLTTQIQPDEPWRGFFVRLGQELGHSENFMLGVEG